MANIEQIKKTSASREDISNHVARCGGCQLGHVDPTTPVWDGPAAMLYWIPTPKNTLVFWNNVQTAKVPMRYIGPVDGQQIPYVEPKARPEGDGCIIISLDD